MPLNEQAIGLAWKTVSAENGDIRIGRKLYQLLTQTGFDIKEHFCEATIKTADTISDLAWLIGVMRKRMESFGLLKDNSPILSALNNNTLAEQLANELKIVKVAYFYKIWHLVLLQQKINNYDQSQTRHS